MNPLRCLKNMLPLTATIFLTATLSAQPPDPVPPQSQPIALVGGTAHLGNGAVIENAVVAFEAGKLKLVSQASGGGLDGKYQVIDVKGQHVYPGLILPHSDLGLTEVSAVRASIDRSETGDYNPNVRALIAYNTDSELISTLRFNGILLAQVVPAGGIVSGTSSVVHLDAWNWEDAAYKADDGIQMDWPNRITRRFDFNTFSVVNEPNKEYDNTVRTLEKLFGDAASYGKLANCVATNLKLAAMQGLFDGSQTLFVNTNDAKAMVESVKFARKHGVKKVVIVGGSEALMVKGFLKAEQIPVILTDIHATPRQEAYDIDAPFKLPYHLHQEGIPFCLGYDGVMSSRNLAFVAGTAAAYGLTKEQALQAITGSTAKILGIDDRAGTLEAGKDATLFVSKGDALDMRGNQLTYAFIQGRQITLDARQQALFERYKKKYGH